MENQEHTTSESTQNFYITPEMVEAYKNKLRQKQNFVMGIVGGFTVGLVGALLWAMITVWTGYQITYMAIGMGVLVGFAIQFLGKGIDIQFAILGAVLSLFACFLGNILSTYGFIANQYEMGYLEALSSMEFSTILNFVIDNIDVMDLLFYGVALYVGFTASRVGTKEEDVLEDLQSQNS